ncbi:hypothetical protein [Rudaea sp.]|uniref:hypothetical protein n=1 Tax=Rudaea sp. TaxID=2136325 RepID=UPI00321F7582
MPLSRHRHRRWIALVALLGLLFQQVAMAAYACPTETRGAVAMAASSDMPDCTEPGKADLARCQQHCHPLTQTSDHGTAPTVPPALLPPTTWLRAASWHPVRWHDDVVHGVIARAAAPPLNIQHCTFQI